MKKLVFLTQNLDIGGVQKFVFSFLEIVCARYACSLILLEDNKPREYRVSKSVKIYEIPLKRFDLQKENVGLAIFEYRKKKLQNVVDRINPDLIFSHEDYHNILSLHITSPAKRILTCHISIGNFYSRSSKIHLLDSQFYYKNIQNLYKNADKVICVSQLIEQELCAISDQIKTITILNGIDQQVISEVSKNDIDIDFEYILHVGRLHPQKGQKDLILAYNKIHESIPYKLIIIGDGPLCLELKKLTETLGLCDKVIFLGNIQTPYHYMKNARFCVTPSYQEGSSIAALEMMYISSLLSARYNGHNEIMKDYGNLFEVGDINQLAECMLKFIENSSLVKELKQLQNTDVLTFTFNKTSNEYSKVIEYFISS